MALQLGQYALDRSTRCSLHDDEVQHHYPEQRRDNEQQSTEYVRSHRTLSAY
jgi:hypothetical protein